MRAILAALLLLSLVMLLRRGGVKLLGPVFFYDTIRSARRDRYFLIRTLYAGLILGLLCWTYFIWRLRAVDGAIPTAELATFAESFFYVFLGVQMLAVLLLTPAFVAGAIAEEKERQTLDYLLTTDLRNREIVLGKLVSRLGNLALLVLSGLPILSLMEMLGGVEPRLVLGAFAVTGITLVFLAAVSLLCSVHARRARDAILLTYLLVLAFPVVTGGALALVEFAEIQKVVVVREGVLPWLTTVPQEDPDLPPLEEPITLESLAERLNDGSLPMFVYRLVREVGRGSTVAEELPPLLRGYAWANLALAALCIVWAVLAVRRVALRQRHRAAVPLRGRAIVRRPPIGGNPLLWKEAIAESGFRASFVRRAITYLTVIAVAVPTGAILFDFLAFGELGVDLTTGWVRVLVIVMPMLSLLAVAVRASAAVSGERDRQTLDQLLTIPVSSDAILLSKWLGCLLGLRWMILAVTVSLALCAAMGGISIAVVPNLLILWPIYAGLIAMVGLACSVTCQTTLRATLATLLATVMLVVGHWSLWLIYVPFLLASDAPSGVLQPLLQLHQSFTPPVVLARLAASAGAEGFGPEGEASPILGLTSWLAATMVVWLFASRRFRIMANRMPLEPPGPPPKEEEAAAFVRTLGRGRSRRRVAVALAVLLPIAAIVGTYVYIAQESERRLHAVIAELDASDPGWRLADLEAARKVLPIEQNSAEQVRKVGRLLPRSWPALPPGPASGPKPNVVDELPSLPPDRRLSDEQEQDLREMLAAVNDARVESLKLADMPEGRYPLTWAPVLIWTVLNDQQQSRTVAILLRGESANRAQTGDVDGALRAVRAILNVARATGDEPILISQLIRMAGRKVAVEALERALAQGAPSESELVRLQRMLEEEEREPLLIRAYRSERAFFHETMEQIRSGKLKVSQFAPGGPAQDLALAASAKTAHPWGLRHLNRLVELERLPLHEQIAAGAELDAEVKKGPWIYQQLSPSTFSVNAAYRRSLTWMRSAIAAVAAERFRRQQGRWPTSIEEMVPAFLAAVPLDPRDGEPLRMRRLEDRIVIYSIGDDGQDNGGKIHSGKDVDCPGSDLGFRLWDVKQRQKAATPGVSRGR
jgi:ABC-type transport system involved in multi-copper enzyme maturation permease subunit